MSQLPWISITGRLSICRLEDSATGMGLDELAPVSQRGASWGDARRLRRFARGHEDPSNRPRLLHRKFAATGGCQESESQGRSRIRKPV